MKINTGNSVTFGWNIKTHLTITEEALKDSPLMSDTLKRYVARCSELPDLDRKETVDANSRHFFDVQYWQKDPSFGTKNDAKNNALSAFLMHDRIAKNAAKKGDLNTFLREIGYAAHYLQDGGTPPHTEHGNYAHKLYRLPMHMAYERGKKIGATSRLNILLDNLVREDIPFKSLQELFLNVASYTIKPENIVRYHNVRKWPISQQNCFNHCVNATAAYMKHVLQYMPKK